jgi:uncharacterized protein (TIGR02271 family)
MSSTKLAEHPMQPRQPQEVQIPDVIPVIQEQLVIDKEVVEKDRVLISKHIREQEETVNVALTSEDVSVERVPINQYVAEPPPPVRYEGNVMIIPVLREVVVVEKRLVLVEELRVTKNQIQTQDTQQVTLRREEIEVRRASENDSQQNRNDG